MPSRRALSRRCLAIRVGCAVRRASPQWHPSGRRWLSSVRRRWRGGRRAPILEGVTRSSRCPSNAQRSTALRRCRSAGGADQRGRSVVPNSGDAGQRRCRTAVPICGDADQRGRSAAVPISGTDQRCRSGGGADQRGRPAVQICGAAQQRRRSVVSHVVSLARRCSRLFVEEFRNNPGRWPQREELRGGRLRCHCPPGASCHADSLIVLF